jgi:hypothetical protein
MHQCSTGVYSWTICTLQALKVNHFDTTLFSNRSLCWLRLGEGEQALEDARKCQKLRSNWAKGLLSERSCPDVSEGATIEFSLTIPLFFLFAYNTLSWSGVGP